MKISMLTIYGQGHLAQSGRPNCSQIDRSPTRPCSALARHRDAKYTLDVDGLLEAVDVSTSGGWKMRRVPTAMAAAVLVATAFVGGVIARSPSTPGYQVVNVGAYGGEPSIVSDTNGNP